MVNGMGIGGVKRALGAGVLAAVICGGSSPAAAGSLSVPASAADPTNAAAVGTPTAPLAMPTLEDLYQRLVSGSAGATAPYGRRTSGAFQDPAEMTGGGTMHSLEDLLIAAPPAAASDPELAAPADTCSGQKYFGLRTGNWGAAQVGSRDCTAPSFTQPTTPQTTAEDTTKTVALTVSDAGTATASLTWRGSSSNPAVLPADGISFSYSSGWSAALAPAANQTGDATVTLSVSDAAGNSTSRTFTLTVTAADDAPVAAADRYTVTPYGVLTVAAANGVLANDSDPEGQTKTVKATPLCNPAHGTLALNADGGFTYRNDGTTGTDSCSYTVEASGATDTATLSFVVGSMNEAPVVNLLPATGSCTLAGGSGSCPIDIGSTSTITDNGANLAWMKVAITTNGTGGDALSLSSAPAAGIGEAYTAGGILYLAGQGTKANYQAALRNVRFNATAGANTTRTITVTVGDGESTHSDTVDITVAP